MSEYIITREGASIPIIDLGEIEEYPNGSNWNATRYDTTFRLNFPNNKRAALVIFLS